MDQKRLTITKTKLFSPYDFEGKLVDMIATLQKYVDEHGDSITIEYNTGWGDDDPEYELRWQRPETTAEEKQRRKFEAAQHEANMNTIEKEKVNRRKMYLKLKEEFAD